MKEKCTDIQKRLNRIKGQVNGIDKMVEESRDPIEVVQQISAVRSALSKLATELLKDESKECFEKKDENDAQRLRKFEELVTNLFRIT